MPLPQKITAPADLPPPELVAYSRNDIRHPCPRCGHSAYRDKQAHRTLHDLGNLDRWCPGAGRHVFAALLYAVSPVLQRRPLGFGPPGQSLYPPRDQSGRAPRGRGWLALSPGELASVARPAGLRALCHDPKLGGGGGEKKRRRAWPPTSSTGPWLIFRAMWRSINCMTVPSAFSPQSIIAVTSASSMTSWTTPPPMMISGPF